MGTAVAGFETQAAQDSVVALQQHLPSEKLAGEW